MPRFVMKTVVDGKDDLGSVIVSSDENNENSVSLIIEDSDGKRVEALLNSIELETLEDQLTTFRRQWTY